MIYDGRPNFARVYGPGSFINYRDLGRRKSRTMGISRRTAAAIGTVVLLLALSFSIAGIVGYDAGRQTCMADVSDRLDQAERRIQMERDVQWSAPRENRAIFIDMEVAPAPTPVPEIGADDGAGVMVVALKAIEAGRSKKWEVACGLALMVLVWVARKAAPTKIPKDYLGTFTLGITALGGFGAAIAAGLPVVDSALTTLLLGAAAIGFWEAAFKHLSKWVAKDTEGP